MTNQVPTMWQSQGEIERYFIAYSITSLLDKRYEKDSENAVPKHMKRERFIGHPVIMP